MVPGAMLMSSEKSVVDGVKFRMNSPLINDWGDSVSSAWARTMRARPMVAVGGSPEGRHTSGPIVATGALVGTAAGYCAAIGFFRTNQLDQLSELGHPPVAELVWILAVMPLIAVAASWLLAGREPPAISRQPLE